MPNLVRLAQLEVVEKSGELNLVTRKKERKKIHFWLEIGQFQTVIKSKLFRISTCGKRERINKGIMSSNIRFHEVW